MDSKIAGSYNLIMDRLDNSHYTINQMNNLYYDKLILTVYLEIYITIIMTKLILMIIIMTKVI